MSTKDDDGTPDEGFAQGGYIPGGYVPIAPMVGCEVFIRTDADTTRNRAILAEAARRLRDTGSGA